MQRDLEPCLSAQGVLKSAARRKCKREFNQHYRHNYGQLLILNAGGGYRVLLVGMERISVRLGAVRGNGRAHRSDGRRSPMDPCQSGRCKPTRIPQDGVPVDPGPWWAAK